MRPTYEACRTGSGRKLPFDPVSGGEEKLEDAGGEASRRGVCLFVQLTEHFRTVALPQKGEEWATTLPKLPLPTNELRVQLSHRQQTDELAAMRLLAQHAQLSADVIVYLEFTRATIAEATKLLYEDRREQVTLVRVLGGAGYRTLVGKKLYHTKYPREYCFLRDSFVRMLDCYESKSKVQRGAEVAAFLVRTLKVTKLPEARLLSTTQWSTRKWSNYNSPRHSREDGRQGPWWP